MLLFWKPAYQIASAGPSKIYHASGAPLYLLVAIGISALAVAAVFYGLSFVGRRYARAANLLLGVLYAWVIAALPIANWNHVAVIRIACVLCAAGYLFAVWKGPGWRIRKIWRDVATISWFPLAWVLIRALWFVLVVYPPQLFADNRPMPLTKAAVPAHRVVWIIFDETSQLVLEQEIKAGHAPHWAELVRESMVCTDAHSPAKMTDISLPALTTGEEITSVDKAGPSILRLQRANAPPVSWRQADTIFSWTRRHGYPTSIVGWYHPYGRLFGDITERTVWEPLPQEFAYAVTSPIHNAVQETSSDVRMLWASVPLARRTGLFHLKRLSPENYIAILRYLLQPAIEEASNSKRAFVFLHLSIPHPPGIYDSATKSLDGSRDHSYRDNVRLTDVVLGQIRSAMEKSEVWNASALIVSSDHTWRKAMWRDEGVWTPEDQSTDVDDRIPFVVHLPEVADVDGSANALRIDQPVFSILSRQLVEQFLTGQLRTPAQVRSWIVSQSKFEANSEKTNETTNIFGRRSR